VSLSVRITGASESHAVSSVRRRRSISPKEPTGRRGTDGRPGCSPTGVMTNVTVRSSRGASISCSRMASWSMAAVSLTVIRLSRR
jgi:hypothetical protein